MNEKELAELTDATVKAIKAAIPEVQHKGTFIDWDLIWTLVGNALAEAGRRGGVA